MAYGKQMPAGEQLGGETMDEGAHADAGAEAQPIKIPSANLPPGIKEGDCLRCTGMDQDGCTFTLEAGDGKGGAGKPDEGTSWESDFRKEMSPQEPQQAAM